jgi:hypothetical protein
LHETRTADFLCYPIFLLCIPLDHHSADATAGSYQTNKNSHQIASAV